ncbi:MAG: hypothetical protein BWY06_03229 [Candidatus Latescibacteria bacterium ADurb.Bin168]|nr:MAG: hypothetical protein BWY06_03229 [Candidatus Latescibacteria bacterium ADurb.Bin168]
MPAASWPPKTANPKAASSNNGPKSPTNKAPVPSNPSVAALRGRSRSSARALWDIPATPRSVKPCGPAKCRFRIFTDNCCAWSTGSFFSSSPKTGPSTGFRFCIHARKKRVASGEQRVARKLLRVPCPKTALFRTLPFRIPNSAFRIPQTRHSPLATRFTPSTTAQPVSATSPPAFAAAATATSGSNSTSLWGPCPAPNNLPQYANNSPCPHSAAYSGTPIAPGR